MDDWLQLCIDRWNSEFEGHLKALEAAERFFWEMGYPALEETKKIFLARLLEKKRAYLEFLRGDLEAVYSFSNSLPPQFQILSSPFAAKDRKGIFLESFYRIFGEIFFFLFPDEMPLRKMLKIISPRLAKIDLCPRCHQFISRTDRRRKYCSKECQREATSTPDEKTEYRRDYRRVYMAFYRAINNMEMSQEKAKLWLKKTEPYCSLIKKWNLPVDSWKGEKDGS